MELIVTDASRRDLTAIVDYDLDLAFGADENSFELVCREGPELSEGCLVYADGTEYGGVVDKVAVDTELDTVTYSGRTWQGVLAGKVLVPDSGKGYLTASGSATSALSSLVARCGLGAIFSVAPPESGAAALVGTYRFERFCDAYSGIRGMLRASSLKLSMRREGGRVSLRAEPVGTYGDEVDSDRIEFKIERDYRPVNHLVCAGEGELENRAVVNFYADAKGAVSHSQTLFGIDERAALYTYSNADEAKLEEEGRKKLAELQGQGEIKITVTDGSEYSVGDVLTGWYARRGQKVTAEVTKKVLKVDGGVPSVSYECGTTTAQQSSLSGSAESGGGGHAYYAGEGLKLTNWTFSADVTQAELDGAIARADAAAKAAGDAAASVGGKVGSVAASAPLAASRAGDAVSLSLPEASPGVAGAMGAADKAKLDGIEAGANRYVLPVAADGVLGGVRPDGRSVTVDGDGTISAHLTVDPGAGGFLAAHPVGCVYEEVTGTDPGTVHGGTWAALPSLGAFKWERTG